MKRRGPGHRTVPHTADICVEAWGATREQCLEQAVQGAVEAFVDAAHLTAQKSRSAHLGSVCDEDLLVAVLDEMIYLVDTVGEVPVETTVTARGDGIDVGFGLVDVRGVTQVGAVPKGVSLHQLRLVEGRNGWSCSVVLDV